MGCRAARNPGHACAARACRWSARRGRRRGGYCRRPPSRETPHAEPAVSCTLARRGRLITPITMDLPAATDASAAVQRARDGFALIVGFAGLITRPARSDWCRKRAQTKASVTTRSRGCPERTGERLRQLRPIDRRPPPPCSLLRWPVPSRSEPRQSRSARERHRSGPQPTAPAAADTTAQRERHRRLPRRPSRAKPSP